jgi:WhiB family redox-sensing transcriptional regulator
MTNSASTTSSAGSTERRRGRAQARLGQGRRGRALTYQRQKIGAAESWWESGLCRGTDPLLFFPPEDDGRLKKQDREQAAVALCARCPVRLTCLDHALAVPEQFGVWGGTTEIQRRKMLDLTGSSSAVANARD